MNGLVANACVDRKQLPDRLQLKQVKRYPAGDPLPRDPIGQKFTELFPNGWDWIYANVPDKQTRPEWETVKHYPLTPQLLWDYFQDPLCLIGIRPKSETRWLVIDLDKNSPYHISQSSNAIGRIRDALEAIGICRVQVNQSSFSGGLHLYCPLSEPVSSFWLAVTVKYALESVNIPLKSGQCEIFPNPKRYKPRGKGFSNYAAIRLPMQPDSGFIPLDDDYQPLPWDLQTWLEQFECLSINQDMTALHRAIAEAKESFRQRKKREPRSVLNWQATIATEKEEGWTGHGQTNEKLKTFACEARVFLGLETIDAIADHVHDTAITSPGFHEYSNHVRDIRRRSLEIAAWAYEYYWPYGTNPQRSTTYKGDSKIADFKYHQDLKQKSQEKIKAARLRLEASGELLPGITERATQLIFEAKISRKTLYKSHNLELWHPRFDVHPETKKPETQSEKESLPFEFKPEISVQSRSLHTLQNKESFHVALNEGFVGLPNFGNAVDVLPLKGQRTSTAANSSDSSDRQTISNWDELKASLPPRLQKKICQKQKQFNESLESQIPSKPCPHLFRSVENKEKDQNYFVSREPSLSEVDDFEQWYHLAQEFGCVSDFCWLNHEYFVRSQKGWIPFCELSAVFTLSHLRKILGIN